MDSCGPPLLRPLRQPPPRRVFPAWPAPAAAPRRLARLGRPRRRPPGPLRSSLRPLLALSILLSAAPGPTGDALARCHAWQRSHGVERILLGNTIGAAHYLTKRRKLLASPADAPIALYQDSDLQRVCSPR